MKNCLLSFLMLYPKIGPRCQVPLDWAQSDGRAVRGPKSAPPAPKLALLPNAIPGCCWAWCDCNCCCCCCC